MTYIVLIAVVGILLLQMTGSIPQSSVGGSMTIGLAFVVAALAVGIHEAWTKKRGVLGWIVNIVVSFVGAFVGANLSGMVVIMMLMLLNLLGLVTLQGSSIAAQGFPLTEVSLAGMMLGTLLTSWGALQIVNRCDEFDHPVDARGARCHRSMAASAPGAAARFARLTEAEMLIYYA